MSSHCEKDELAKCRNERMGERWASKLGTGSNFLRREFLSHSSIRAPRGFPGSIDHSDSESKARLMKSRAITRQRDIFKLGGLIGRVPQGSTRVLASPYIIFSGCLFSRGWRGPSRSPVPA